MFPWAFFLWTQEEQCPCVRLPTQDFILISTFLLGCHVFLDEKESHRRTKKRDATCANNLNGGCNEGTIDEKMFLQVVSWIEFFRRRRNEIKIFKKYLLIPVDTIEGAESSCDHCENNILKIAFKKIDRGDYKRATIVSKINKMIINKLDNMISILKIFVEHVNWVNMRR